MRPRVDVPRSAKKDEIIVIKTAIRHKMQGGVTAKPGDRQSLLPQNQFIETFVATFNSQEVFRAKLSPTISANPFLSFTMKISGPGEFEFIWTENTGKSWSVKRKLIAT